MNVWGDSVGAGVVERLSQKQLGQMDDEDNLEKNGNGELNRGYEDSTINTML